MRRGCRSLGDLPLDTIELTKKLLSEPKPRDFCILCVFLARSLHQNKGTVAAFFVQTTWLSTGFQFLPLWRGRQYPLHIFTSIY
jgi:hypothetical protein